jgi:hypothetical protein
LAVVNDYFNFLPIESIEIGAEASKKALEKEKLKRIEQIIEPRAISRRTS